VSKIGFNILRMKVKVYLSGTMQQALVETSKGVIPKKEKHTKSKGMTNEILDLVIKDNTLRIDNAKNIEQ